MRVLRRVRRLDMARRIVIDSREQRPYDFGGDDFAIRKALPSGDYSLEGLEERFAIERKSLQDWVNTVVHGKERFAKELERLQSYDYACVVVEATLEDILSGNYRSKIAPDALLGKTCGIMVGYGIPVLFAGDRPHACAMVRKLLAMGERKYR